MTIIDGKFSAPSSKKLDDKSLQEIQEELLSPQMANLSLSITIAEKMIQDEIKLLKGV